jgi:hypothetical protein
MDLVSHPAICDMHEHIALRRKYWTRIPRPPRGHPRARTIADFHVGKAGVLMGRPSSSIILINGLESQFRESINDLNAWNDQNHTIISFQELHNGKRCIAMTCGRVNPRGRLNPQTIDPSSFITYSAKYWGIRGSDHAQRETCR